MNLLLTTDWIIAPVVIPLATALLAFVGKRRYAVWLLPPMLVVLFLSLYALTLQLQQQGPLRYAIGGWGAPLGIDLYFDGLSLLMLWLSAIVGTLVSLYSVVYFRNHPQQADHFWPLWLLLWCGLNALFLSADIFNLYVTLEMLTLSAVPLVALAGSAAALAGAMRYLLYALLGSLIYLLGVALLYAGYGVLDIAMLGQVLKGEPLTWAAIALLVAGLLIKTALFPLHFWLPGAHASAPAPVSAVLSALVVKASFYLLLRLSTDMLPGLITSTAAQLLGALGAGAIIYGSIQALRQARLKLLIAYSTVAQLGYLLLIFPLAGTVAWGGVVLHALSHGIAKAAMFLAAGNVLLSLGHDRITALGRCNSTLVLSFLALGLAGIAIIGLPPSGGFLGKWLLLQAAAETSQWWWLAVIVLGGLLAAAYIFRVLAYAFVRPLKDHPPPPVLPRVLELTPLALALLAIVMGFGGAPLLSLLGSHIAVFSVEITP